MHPLIRFAAFLVFLGLAALSVLAGPETSRPVQASFVHQWQIKTLNNLLQNSSSGLSFVKKSNEETLTSSVMVGRICSCQILNLESSNYDHRFMVLLAEKSNDVSEAGFKKTRNRIQKEKRRLKLLFYDKIKLVAEIQAKGSCKSMYFRLHSTDSNLQLYEILNAD